MYSCSYSTENSEETQSDPNKWCLIKVTKQRLEQLFNVEKKGNKIEAFIEFFSRKRRTGQNHHCRENPTCVQMSTYWIHCGLHYMCSYFMGNYICISMCFFLHESCNHTFTSNFKHANPILWHCHSSRLPVSACTPAALVSLDGCCVFPCRYLLILQLTVKLISFMQEQIAGHSLEYDQTKQA